MITENEIMEILDSFDVVSSDRWDYHHPKETLTDYFEAITKAIIDKIKDNNNYEKEADYEGKRLLETRFKKGEQC